MNLEHVASAIRDVPDFPKKGIVFKDITPLLKRPDLMKTVVRSIADRYRECPPDCVAGIESRGFIFGSLLANELDCGFIPIRKKGKLPYRTIAASYSLEYGTAEVEIHEDAVSRGERVVIVDDLIATGGTVKAAISLIERLGGNVVGLEFVVELAFLGGRNGISGYPIRSLVVCNAESD
jgi:adenine phosphoribosyltransferase